MIDKYNISEEKRDELDRNSYDILSGRVNRDAQFATVSFILRTLQEVQERLPNVDLSAVIKLYSNSEKFLQTLKEQNAFLENFIRPMIRSLIPADVLIIESIVDIWVRKGIRAFVSTITGYPQAFQNFTYGAVCAFVLRKDYLKNPKELLAKAKHTASMWQREKAKFDGRFDEREKRRIPVAENNEKKNIENDKEERERKELGKSLETRSKTDINELEEDRRKGKEGNFNSLSIKEKRKNSRPYNTSRNPIKDVLPNIQFDFHKYQFQNPNYELLYIIPFSSDSFKNELDKIHKGSSKLCFNNIGTENGRVVFPIQDFTANLPELTMEEFDLENFQMTFPISTKNLDKIELTVIGDVELRLQNFLTDYIKGFGFNNDRALRIPLFGMLWEIFYFQLIPLKNKIEVITNKYIGYLSPPMIPKTINTMNPSANTYELVFQLIGEHEDNTIKQTSD
jgi:hypothetical protein